MHLSGPFLESQALRSLRQLSAGIGTELAAFRAAALVPALGDAPEDKRTCEEQARGLGFRV